jgi:predicted DCC family thiol-disulfide oxidoreductase YuxK
VLIYDGDCGFCKRSLGWLIRLGATCDYQAWQRSDLAALGLTELDVTQAAWFVDGDRSWRGHLAIARALRSSRYAPVRLLGRVIGARVLGPVGRPLYRWVADHRHQLPGGSPSCTLD